MSEKEVVTDRLIGGRARLKLAFLGAPQVELDGRPLATDRRKAVALLAYLAETGRPHTRDTLAGLLWPDYDQSSALAYLRRTLWELTSSLGQEWFAADRQQVSLVQSDAVWLDSRAFAETVAARADLELLVGAVELYRDHFLAGFNLPDAPAFDAWQAQTRQQLQTVLVQALEELAAGYQSRGELGQALAHARRLVALDDLNEAAHRQLMLLYSLAGQRSAALEQYESCRRILADELGLEPGPETTALWQQIRAGRIPAAGTGGGTPPDGGREGAPTIESPTAVERASPEASPAIQLPAPPTPFVGRQQELVDLSRLLADPEARLISLVGPGGAGKTRLAIEAARLASPRFRDGTVFVALAPLSSGEDIWPLVSKTLDLHSYHDEMDSPQQQLLNYLREREMLLVMDNYEHLADRAGIELLSDILAAAPGLRVLATTRARLNVPAERLFAVAGLDTPPGQMAAEEQEPRQIGEQYGALALFRQSARQVEPLFELTADNLGPVVEICRMLQGLPLGIELAAAWVNLLSPEEIAREISHSLDFLDDPGLARPERQRSLRAVFDSSWGLLTPAEQNAFLPLTVFRGGFGLRAAERVSGGSLRLLLGLVNKSWLQRIDEDRYQIHEMLRQYGQELLAGDEEAWIRARQAHCDYFVAFLEARELQLRGPQQWVALEGLANESENIRSALWWCIDQGQYETISWRVLPALLRYMVMRITGRSLLTLMQILEDALETAEGPDVTLYRTIVRITQAQIHDEVWHAALARECLVAAWEAAEAGGDPFRERLRFWDYVLAVLYAWHVDLAVGIRHLEEHLPGREGQADPWLRAWCCEHLADLYAHVGQTEKAAGYYQEALELFRRLGDTFETAQALHGLAAQARVARDFDRALELLHQAQELLQAAGSRVWSAAINVFDLVEIYLQKRDFEAMFESLEQGKAYLRRMGSWSMLTEAYNWEGIHLSRYKSPEKAFAVRFEQLELIRKSDNQAALAWCYWELGELFRLVGDREEARRYFQKAAEVFEITQVEMGQGFLLRAEAELAMAEGNWALARERFQAYHDLSRQLRHMWSVAFALDGLGRAAVELGSVDEAANYFRRSIQQAMELGNQDLALRPLLGLARVRLAGGDVEGAVFLADFVFHYPLSWWETRNWAKAILDEALAGTDSDRYLATLAAGREAELADILDRFALKEPATE
jgi:predicted ATPase/DNA-binding SARP family transcriptional activator